MLSFIQIVLLFWHGLFSAQIPFPGPGRASTAGGASPAFVNATSLTGAVLVTDFTLTGFNTTAGNALVVLVSYSTGAGCSVPTPTLASTAGGSPSGDTFTQIGSSVAQAFQCTIVYRAFGIAGATSNSYIITASSTGWSTAGMGAMQFTVVSSLDQTCSGTGSGATIVCSGSMTPSTSPEVVVGIVSNYYFADTAAAGSGFTIPMGGTAASGTDGTPGSLYMEYLICASGCTGNMYTPDMAITGTGYTNIIGATLQ